MNKELLKLPKVEAVDIMVNYIESKNCILPEGNTQHVHEECEIYINLSGDVSFMVEDKIYPICPGDIVITRPYEYHHCIYNSDKLHKHFWILFSSKGNEDLLDIFFKRKLGENNHIRLSLDNKNELINLCHKMRRKNTNGTIENYLDFFKLMFLLKSGEHTSIKKNDSQKDLQLALSYLSYNFNEPISVKEIAAAAHMSVNTLERKFEKALGVTPHNYLRNKRLSNAVKLLSQGENVTDACVKSGFSDCSSFIALFKKTYGVTPLKYKQQNNKF